MFRMEEMVINAEIFPCNNFAAIVAVKFFLSIGIRIN
jgi:hypothetical protein